MHIRKGRHDVWSHCVRGSILIPPLPRVCVYMCRSCRFLFFQNEITPCLLCSSLVFLPVSYYERFSASYLILVAAYITTELRYTGVLWFIYLAPCCNI